MFNRGDKMVNNEMLSKYIFIFFIALILIISILFPDNVTKYTITVLIIFFVFINFDDLQSIEIPSILKCNRSEIKQNTKKVSFVPLPQATKNDEHINAEILKCDNCIKVLKTLWKYQQEYFREGKKSLWLHFNS